MPSRCVQKTLLGSEPGIQLGLLFCHNGIDSGIPKGLLEDGEDLVDVHLAVDQGQVILVVYVGTGSDLIRHGGGVKACLLYTSDAADD